MYDFVTDIPFFKDIIEDKDKELVISKFVKRTYPKNHILYQQDDEGTEMYVVKSGSLKIFRQDDHREIIFGHQFPGEVFGELELFHYNNRRTASLATLEKTVLWMIKKIDMDELVKRYPEILRKTLYILSERLTQADRKLEYLAFLDTRVRVANLLLDLNSNFGVEIDDEILINWKITQQHFANMIGVGRETLARTLKELQDEGLLRIHNRYMYILDLTAIKRISGPEVSSTDGRIWHSSHKYDTTLV